MKIRKIVISRILLPLFAASLLLLLMLSYVILFPKNIFHSSYQSIIQDKYENLLNTPSPKIIIVGGSSACFGVDENLLEKRTGYPVVNLGLHAGFGGLFNTEISKANINDGDIVLLAYEYGWPEEIYFKEFGTDLVMSGIDSKYEIYRYVPFKEFSKMIGYFPEYCKQKANYQEAQGTYSRASFDESAHIVLEREFSMEGYDPKTWGGIDLSETKISDNSIRYLKNFKKYVEGKGAALYFAAPPLYKKAQISTDESFMQIVQEEEKMIGIKYISNPLDYFYSDEYMFDTIYHCSSRGEIKRTEQLADDIAAVLKSTE